MKATHINCPNCNSPQKFVPREKVESDTIIKYVACLMCRENFIIDTYPVNEKKIRSKAVILRTRKMRRQLRGI